MKRILCAALALLLLGACTAAPAPELLEPVAIGSDLATATVGELIDGEVLSGVILPETEELSFGTDGQVGELLAEVGDRVKKGDPLLRLRNPELNKRREELEEKLENARAMDEFDSRTAELNRQQLAEQSGYYSASYQFYVNEQESAAQRRTAEIETLERDIARIDKQLEEGAIYAPFDGTMAAVRVTPGSRVERGKTVAIIAADSGCLLETEFVSEANVKKKAAVYATIGGKRYEVSYVSVEEREYLSKTLAGETVSAKFEVKGGKSELVGQYALLYLLTAQREQALTIPINALHKDAAGYYVYTDQNGEMSRRDVEVGLRTSAQAEILSGLEEGESVYVVG